VNSLPRQKAGGIDGYSVKSWFPACISHAVSSQGSSEGHDCLAAAEKKFCEMQAVVWKIRGYPGIGNTAFIKIRSREIRPSKRIRPISPLLKIFGLQ